MENKAPEKNRTEIIYALAGHIRSTSPISYHEIIKWDTEWLRALLEWYERPPEIEITFRLSQKAVKILLERINLKTL